MWRQGVDQTRPHRRCSVKLRTDLRAVIPELRLNGQQRSRTATETKIRKWTKYLATAPSSSHRGIMTQNVCVSNCGRVRIRHTRAGSPLAVPPRAVVSVIAAQQHATCSIDCHHHRELDAARVLTETALSCLTIDEFDRRRRRGSHRRGFFGMLAVNVIGRAKDVPSAERRPDGRRYSPATIRRPQSS